MMGSIFAKKLQEPNSGLGYVWLVKLDVTQVGPYKHT